MIITKCPLRLSLVGGSTDLESFINSCGNGRVISFPCNKYVYIALHENNRGKFFINYSKKEEADKISDIQNDVAREVLTFFNEASHINELQGLSISFNSDVYSEGGGLGASSAYMIALIKAMSMYCRIGMSNIEICKLALDLERKFNPLTGRQDTYGCGMPNFKKMVFKPNDTYPEFTYFKTKMLNRYHMYLLHTGVNRSSTNILESLETWKCGLLLDDVDSMEKALANDDERAFSETLRKGWENKKKTSPQIVGSPRLMELESKISNAIDLDQNDAFKINGAGGGGYFLILTMNNQKFLKNIGPDENIISVRMDEDGVKGIKI